MKRTLLSFAVGSAVAASATAHALPFNTFEPRTMAMGGAGVAIGNVETAPLLNPALLAIKTKNDDDYSPALTGGMHVFLPRETFDDADAQADALDATISSYNNTPVTYDPLTGVDTSGLRAMADATRDVSTLLASLDNQPVTSDLGGALIPLVIPSKTLGVAFAITNTTHGNGGFSYQDEIVLENVASDIDAYADWLEAMDACQAAPATCPTPPSLTYVDTFGQINFDPENDIQSNLGISAISVSEAGLSLAHEFDIGGNTFALGITPKYTHVLALDYVATVQSANLDHILDQDYNEYNDINLDIGLAKRFDNGWHTGLVVKNVISREYETPNGAILELKPQARLGIAHQTGWTTFALDVDLTENQIATGSDVTQYAALGAELNFFDWLQLRGGYRADLANSDRTLASIGLGVAPFSGAFHVDLAATFEEFSEDTDELGLALQFGARF